VLWEEEDAGEEECVGEAADERKTVRWAAARAKDQVSREPCSIMRACSTACDLLGMRRVSTPTVATTALCR
jgi:hypothetical protein